MERGNKFHCPNKLNFWLLWNMSSQKDTPMNALNFSPTSLEGNSPTWTMRSHYRRQACVLKRLSLCRKGISTVAWVLPAFLLSPLCLGHQLIEYAVEGHRIAVLKSGRQLAGPSLSLLPFSLLLWPNESVQSFIFVLSLGPAESIGKNIFPLFSWNKVKELSVYPICWGSQWP